MLNKAIIDLEVLRNNAKNIKNKLPEKVKFNAVVKADAYGHGAPKVANALHNIVDCFSVALVEEGVALRLSGVEKDILVLIPPFQSDLERAVNYNLTLSVASIADAESIEREGGRQNKKVKVHIKYNSGMNRLGVDSLDDLNHIAEYITAQKHLVLDGLFSHLANPENKKDRINAQNNFLLANNLIKGYNNKAICHLSASGGFLSGAYFDMVRIGILLYGYKPFESRAVSVQPIMKIYAPVIERRILSKGQCALYGFERADCDTLITLIRYGYADGLPRRKVQGQFNNRCMDITALNNNVGKNTVCVMDNADDIAADYGTISYEVLTKSAFRAEKIYLN